MEELIREAKQNNLLSDSKFLGKVLIMLNNIYEIEEPIFCNKLALILLPLTSKHNLLEAYNNGKVFNTYQVEIIKSYGIQILLKNFKKEKLALDNKDSLNLMNFADDIWGIFKGLKFKNKVSYLKKFTKNLVLAVVECEKLSLIISDKVKKHLRQDFIKDTIYIVKSEFLKKLKNELLINASTKIIEPSELKITLLVLLKDYLINTIKEKHTNDEMLKDIDCTSRELTDFLKSENLYDNKINVIEILIYKTLGLKHKEVKDNNLSKESNVLLEKVMNLNSIKDARSVNIAI